MTNRGDQRNLFDDIDAVRTETAAEFLQHFIQPAFDAGTGHDNRYGVDAARQMLKIDIIVIQNSQNSADEASFAAHHVLIQRDNHEVLAAGNTCDDPVFDAVASHIIGNHSAGILRMIGVSDIDWHIGHSGREDGILMKHAGAHIGKFPQFLIGNDIYLLRILHDTRICHQES